VEPAGCRYRPGHFYAIQLYQDGRLHNIGRTLIAAVHTSKLGDLTHQQARAEGFKTTSDFAAAWEARYGTHNPDQAVHVLHLAQTTDEPRYLVAQSGRGDYTTNPALAMTGELEPIPQAAQNEISRQANDRYNASHAEQLRRRHARNMARKIQIALEAGIDLTTELDAITRKTSANA
jgi:hypothetical protein